MSVQVEKTEELYKILELIDTMMKEKSPKSASFV